MKSPFKNERKLITDFYMWMVENDYDHNIRIRVENKAELFLRERTKANGVEKSESTCNLQNVTHSALLEASKAIVSNIETWLDTGDPADSKTSKMLYDNLKKAIVDVEHCG